ncbi:MAG: 16S rRNA (cytosine(1402)-N(4))-methyltransferase RsmH [Spirochaetaceae bacterium]|jgi:16S rRNA (cytosine1402-N4)-methyltransferase|nr:16S rRNA (cytosine(1402)-N(4))-methyltransferase RsmH [Spirochaetaceae bacterium]
MDIVHTPALLEETIQYLGPRSGEELMIDATLGEGGHSYAFLSRFPGLSVIGIDADAGILAIARERLKVFGGRVRFYSLWSHDFFANPPGDVGRPDTILIDLGVSVYHYEKSGRGFSFRKDEDLDMRIDPSRGESAAGLIGRLGEKELADILYYNAGERYSRRIAGAIVEARRQGAIRRASVLASIVGRAVPAGGRRSAFHPATKTFQALRIAVNGELERLPSLLEDALKNLKAGGRMGIITFHSAEDRIVKRFFRDKSALSGSRDDGSDGNRDSISRRDTPICRNRDHRAVRLLTRKAISPGEEELRANPPSRSARLRVVEKIYDEECAS